MAPKPADTYPKEIPTGYDELSVAKEARHYRFRRGRLRKEEGWCRCLLLRILGATYCKWRHSLATHPEMD